MHKIESSQHILTLNAGSSSIKFAVFKTDSLIPQQVLSGSIKKLRTSAARLTVFDQNHTLLMTKDLPGADQTNAVQELLAWLEANLFFRSIAGVGHRIVHGGTRFVTPVIITATVRRDLHDLIELDSLHLPSELALIDQIAAFSPKLPQVACFDTAFHHDMPEVAQIFPIPARYKSEGIKRYGFHGLSYTFLLSELKRIAGEERASQRLIFAHLGSGSSIAAVKNGKCLDTTMGFTPIGGIMMGTRPGDLDPGVVLHMMSKGNLTVPAVEKILNEESGLLGVSGSSADVEDLFSAADSGDSLAVKALDLYAYSAQKAIGAYASVLGGLDCLIFSAGIGENSPRMRSKICDNLEYLGIALEEKKNIVNDKVISKGSVPIYVIKTDEEIVIAEAVKNILN